MSVLFIVLALVALERGVELLYARANARRLLARGGVEYARWQHPLFVALHLAWLLWLALFVPAGTAANGPLLALFGALQIARVWVLATLGPYWTTRIISLPGAPLVRRGPYRWMRHPNYAIVVLEIAVLPLAFGAPLAALVFSLLNGALLAVRIRAEEAALSSRYSP